MQIIKIALLVCSLIGFQSLQAKASDETAQIRSTLQENFPNLSVDDITTSPINGLFQVTAGGTVLYVTKDGHYAFSGDIVDLKNAQNNLTENARKTARVKGLKAIGEDNMVVFPAKIQNTPFMFSLMWIVAIAVNSKAKLKRINNLGISVRYLAFPRSGPTSPTAEKCQSLVC